MKIVGIPAYARPPTSAGAATGHRICATEIHRRYQTHHDAWTYLVSRRFACRPDNSWVNGRWAASVQRTEDGIDVAIWLRQHTA
jgi:hypothetical protein